MTMTTLITGATGFIGRRVVHELVNRGEHVRVFCRDKSRLDRSLEGSPLVEVMIGDMRERDSVKRAVAGAARVVHLAATTSGAWGEFYETTVLGTRAILATAVQAQVRRFLYVSSLSVYDFSRIPEGGTVREDAPLETQLEGRNEYARAKGLAEASALEYLDEGALDICIVRPGVVYGPGGKAPMLNTKLSVRGKLFLLIGGGHRELPLVYVDNLVQVLLLLLERPSEVRRVYNVVDPSPPSEREYFTALLRMRGRTAYFVPVPRWPFLVLAHGLQTYRVLRGQTGAMDVVHAFRRVTQAISFDTDTLHRELGWTPHVSFAEGIAAAFSGSLDEAIL
jgi:nucleoside-diphosphate-sugar epimerase